MHKQHIQMFTFIYWTPAIYGTEEKCDDDNDKNNDNNINVKYSLTQQRC